MNTRLQTGIFLTITAILFPVYASAADAIMEVTPSVGTYRVYDDVTVRIAVSSDGQDVTAVEGRLSFNPKELTITHVTKDRSPITSWTQEPRVDRELGVIVFGGAFATGTKLSARTILTLRIRPERAGETLLRFEGGAAIISADGLGSNILTGFKSGKYRIQPEELADGAAPDSAASSPASRASALQQPNSSSSQTEQRGEVLGMSTTTLDNVISSRTHPDQDAWYSTSSSMFTFNIPDYIREFFVSFNREAAGKATKLFDEPVRVKKVDSLTNGIWYMHVSIPQPSGESLSTMYRLHVDHTLPANLSVREIMREDEADPNIKVAFNATDTLSGIAYYTFSVDGGEPVRFVDTGTREYTYRALAPGDHTLTTTVYDLAGNSVSKQITNTVAELPTPELTIPRSEYAEGDALEISVQSIIDGEVEIVIAHNDDPAIVSRINLDAEGKGLYLLEGKLIPGTYTIIGTTHSSAGGISKASKSHVITVSPTFFGTLSRHPMIVFSMLVLLAMLVVGIRMWRRIPNDEEVDMLEQREPQQQGVEKIVYTDEFIDHTPVVLAPRLKK